MIILNRNKDKIIKEAESPHKNHCMGYPGQGPYFTGFAMGSSSVPTKLGNKGSSVLDRINAFDMAEVNDTYLGQINMITVSSFCGPHGLLWGYDIARTEDFLISDDLETEDINEFSDLEIHSGKNLRASTRELFGTNKKRNFPLFPGSHVFTAQKFISSPGPINLYGSFAVGIPDNREENACLFMEDVGCIKNESKEEKRKILKNMVYSIRAIGSNQIVNYKTIYVDIITQKVEKGETGGVLVASPYFLLAKNAYISSTIPDTLKEWKDTK